MRPQNPPLKSLSSRSSAPLGGKRVAAGGAGCPDEEMGAPPEMMHHHEEPEMGKVIICVEIKIARSCCIVASTSTPST